jgi:hypothetical protein
VAETLMFLGEIDKLRLADELPVFPEVLELFELPLSPPQPAARTAVITTVPSATIKREYEKNRAVVSACDVNIQTPCFFMRRPCHYQDITSKKAIDLVFTKRKPAVYTGSRHQHCKPLSVNYPKGMAESFAQDVSAKETSEGNSGPDERCRIRRNHQQSRSVNCPSPATRHERGKAKLENAARHTKVTVLRDRK